MLLNFSVSAGGIKIQMYERDFDMAGNGERVNRMDEGFFGSSKAKFTSLVIGA